MKCFIRSVTENGLTYRVIFFVCPGCIELEAGRGSGLHMIPINTKDKTPAWSWNESRDAPTLSPSIRTKNVRGWCHLYLKDGKIEYLKDSDHSFAGKTVELSDVPQWIINEKGDI